MTDNCRREKAFMTHKLILAFAALVLGGAGLYSCKKSGPSLDQLGVPIYPGARQLDEGSFYRQVKRKDSLDSWQTAVLETADPPQKVIAFYKEKLMGKCRILQTSSRGVPSAVFNADLGARKTNIVVSTDEETQKTRISIASALRQK